MSSNPSQFLPPEARITAEDGAFLHRVLDDLPIALFAKDASNGFRFVLWNKKQEAITTIKKEDAIGKTDEQIFSKESAEYFRKVDEMVVRRGKLVEVQEEIIVTEGAGEIWVHTIKVPVVDEERGRTLVVGISEDITERVQARQQLEHLNANLTAANEELQEIQLQLIQAEKMESVGRLAAGVAHEVKNPLALLLMGVEYLSGGVREGDPNVTYILSEMREAIDRADRIVRGLVDFSSERQLEMEPTDFSDLVQSVLLLLRHELTRGSIGVEIEFEKGLPKVMIDSAKFEQVLVNLFINAIHAMKDAARPTLEVLIYSDKLGNVTRDEGVRTAGHLRSGDEVVVLEVKDNGSGISTENLEKVFDPFFTTKPTGKGTGLGLSVVRKIVELHGGAIAIENREFGGAKARILLRAMNGAEGEAIDSLLRT